jgi:gluconate 5-dehydrogenase
VSTQLFSLEGKGTIVTGAGSGLGRAIAEGAARVGAPVVCADLDAGAAGETADRIHTEGGRAFPVRVDVTSAESVRQMVAESLSLLGGRIDVSYHMAGIQPGRKPALAVTGDDLARGWDVNVRGLFYCCQQVGSVMLAQGKGSIVNAASIMSRISARNNVAYANTKGAVATITQTLALEWSARGVRVNALAPGFMRTPLTAQIQADAAWTRRVEERTPIGRMGEAEEIVGPALFLGSDASSYVTGILLFVDGGWTAM